MTHKSVQVKNAKYKSIIKNIPFFAHLTGEELSVLEKVIIKKNFSKNEVILLEEDTQNFMYIVFSGKIKVVQISIEGKEQILAIHSSGSFFGEMALLDGKTSPATVIAMEDSVIGLISKYNFEKYLLKNEKVFREISSMLCSRLREAWMRLKVLSFADAEQRIKAALKLMSINYGIKDKRGTMIALRLTHKDIAACASVARETVSRLLEKLSKEGDIELIDNKYILLTPSFYKKVIVL